MSNPQLCITILAAGNGTRMNSTYPKVLHLVKDEPMIVRLIKVVLKFDPCKILIVVNSNSVNIIKDVIGQHILRKDCDKLIFVIQDNPKGTGHAVQKTMEFLLICKKLGARDNMILNGDNPCLQYITLIDAYINFLANYKNGTNNLQVVVINLDNPASNGRIIQTKDYIKIVEYKDCTEQQKNIKQINTGIYITDIDLLSICIPKITNKNAQNEYYLTDILKISSETYKFNTFVYLLDSSKFMEIFNVNTREELKYVNEYLNGFKK